MLKFSMNLKINFLKLTLFQKIELYLIVVIFYILIIYFYNEFLVQNKTIIRTSKINASSVNKAKNLNSNITKKNNTYIFKLVEQKSETLNCFIYDIKFQKKSINISIKGKLINIINFLNYLQNHFIIEQYELIYEKNTLFSTITFDTTYLYNPNKIYNELISIPNPFINISKNNNLEIVKKDKILKTNSVLKIDAIVDSNIFINNKWYKINDIIDGKKVLSIKLNSVDLVDIKTSKKINLKVYNENR
jgi:hypothetical protein